MRQYFPSVALAVMALGTLSCVSSPARAGVIDRAYINHGAANCQGALPMFDTLLRKRPLGLANEGTSDAFVTCDMDRIPNPTSEPMPTGYLEIAVAVLTNSTTPLQASCTLVNGILGATFSSSTKSTTVVRNQGAGLMHWTAAQDNGGLRFPAPALSCKLPANAEISYVYSIYGEEVGN